jgi:phosphatidylserine/phosphatidylglycerophosphate/cardiolipin synthase-like enzyme
MNRTFGATMIMVTALLLFTAVSLSQEIIINEVYNSSSTDEWIELLVVQDSLDIRSWDIRDFSTAGIAQTPLTFTSNSLWSLLRKGTLIVIGKNSTAIPTEDTDPSDFLIQLRATNGIYFADSVFTFAGSSDAVQIRNASDEHVFGVSWGTNNAASIPSPKVHFSGSSTSNTSISFNEDSVPELTSTSNWTFNNASPSKAAGNSATNIAWINSLRVNETGDGSGSAAVDPDTMNYGTTSDILLTYHRDTAFTITSMKIIIPSPFGWSHLSSDVSFTNMTATKSVSGDTITLTSVSMSEDSTVITISNVTSPESTAFYTITFQTKVSVSYENVTPLPMIVVFGIASTIADVKGNDVNGIPLRLGQLVTIRGIVTVANEFGGPSYVQDNTSGIGIFGTSFSSAVSVGDEVIVSGIVDPFNGLTELTSPYLHSIVSSGNNVTPLVVTCSQLANDGAGGVELYEGLLVQVNSVVVRNSSGNPIATWAVSGSGTNYRLIDATDTVDIRVDNNVDFANAPAPQSFFDVLGVVSQFKPSTPYIGGYQLMPRFSADILSEGPLFATQPYEDNITSSSLRINWTTVNQGTSRLKYGTTTAYELGVVEPDNIERTVHAVDLSGLQSATIYHTQAFSVANAETSFASDLVVSTASPSGSTGTMNVYFNKSVNTSVSSGEIALANQDLVNRILQRINNAQRSVDACLYSLSGTNEGQVIANALISAKNRGVKVRVICEYDNKNSAAFTSLVSNGITLIDDRYDLINFGAGLMHNKFFVIDYRGGAPESVWVWTGSWNPTDQGTNSDRQNAIEIQDVALAGAYTQEFNEMWGSSTDTPNQTNSRFGARKTDNTPHRFIIDGKTVKSYFSPTDGTTQKIGTTLRKAQHSIGVAVLSFTRKELADSLIAEKNEGKKVRVVVDNNTDIGNQFSYLQSTGVDVHLKGGAGLLHHKYAITDADNLSGTQYTITGSHNWSNSAEGSNNENTLIIEDARVANLYLQEFAARYYEAGGTDSIAVTSGPIFSVNRTSINFGSVNVGESKLDSFIVSNAGNLDLVIDSVRSSNLRFSVQPDTATLAPSDTKKYYVTFSPLIGGSQTGVIVISHNASGGTDTVSVSGYGQAAGGNISTEVYVFSGWNMVSVPVIILNKDKDTVFPSSISDAYFFGNGYQVAESLYHGKGYWLKFGAVDTVMVTGTEIFEDTIDVVTGWNLIGTITHPVAVSAIVESPSGIIVSEFFGYESGYVEADILQPGKAYWVKVSEEGQLILTDSGKKQIVPKSDSRHSERK